MKPHFQQPSGDPFSFDFPTLPILPAEEAKRLTNVEKYGGLYYLGIAGLCILVALVGWFGYSVWTLKPLWMNVYVLHDTSRPDPERVAAAFAIARDPNANQRQRWDIALERNLPPLARYIIAESLTAEAAEADPKAYGLAVSKSEGWPNWLRLLLTRPMVYAASENAPVSIEGLETLLKHPDPAIALWARCGLAFLRDSDAKELRSAAERPGPNRELAKLLLQAFNSKNPPRRIESLDQATGWLRAHHPDAVLLWKGFRVENRRLVPPS